MSAFELTLNDAPAYRIHRVSRLLRVQLVRMLAAHDLSPEQYFVLFRLMESDGRSHRDLTDPALDDRANITRLVGGLQRRGLVHKEADPDDRRVSRVFLTDAGRERFEALVPQIRAIREDLFADVSAADLSAMHRVLDALEARVDLHE